MANATNVIQVVAIVGVIKDGRDMMLYDLGGRVEQYQLEIIIKCVENDISSDCFILGIEYCNAEREVRERGDKDEMVAGLGLKLVCLRRLRKLRGWDK